MANNGKRYNNDHKLFMANYKKRDGTELKTDFPDAFARRFPGKTPPSLPTLRAVQKRYESTGKFVRRWD